MDIDIYLKLIKENMNSTLSGLYLSETDERLCYILEDGYHSTKIKGQTRIPEGRYRLIFREEGSHHEKYKKMFKWHKGMIQIDDVPNYKYILIHIGNNIKDTEGCLLTGMDYVLNMKTGCYEVTKSTIAYTKVIPKIYELMENNRVFINIIRK